MPPFNAPRTYPPSWIDQLRSAVLSPDVRWTPAEVLSVVVATRALRGWLADQRPYDGQHRQGWKSAIADFQRSISHLGPDLRAVLGTDLVAAVSAISQLDADITGNSALTAALLQARRTSDQRILDQLSARWAQPQTRVDTWSDLREACHDPAVTWEALSLRRELFWQLVREGGHDAEQMSRHLAGVLANEAFQVALARLWLGDISEDEVPRPLPATDAELTEMQQLELCERLLTKPATQGHYVVWIAFDLAGHGRYTQHVGPVSFYKAQWLQLALSQRGRPVAMPVPSELQSTEGFVRPSDLPDGAGEVLARVDLGTGAWTNPVRVATEQAEAVVALAGFNIGETRWCRMTGYLVAVDDHIEVLGGFEAVRADVRRADDIYQDAMDAELADLATKLRAHLPITDPEFSEVVKAVHWWEQARKQPPLAAVLLHVRVLELLSQRADVTPWQRYVDEFQQARWVRHLMMQRLHGVIDACLSRAQLIANQADRDYLRDLSRRITTPQPGGYALDLREGFNALPNLVRIFAPHDNIGRRVQDAVSRFTLAALPAWLADLESEWELTLERLRRVRNALAHGGPVNDESAETVRVFVEQLARLSLAVALQGLLEGKTVAVANQERKQWTDRWKAALPAAASVPDALFGPTP
jgi:hypothetical protein